MVCFPSTDMVPCFLSAIENNALVMIRQSQMQLMLFSHFYLFCYQCYYHYCEVYTHVHVCVHACAFRCSICICACVYTGTLTSADPYGDKIFIPRCLPQLLLHLSLLSPSLPRYYHFNQTDWPLNTRDSAAHAPNSGVTGLCHHAWLLYGC